MAEGPAFAGCPTGVCEQTLFGCCDDGETPASALPKAKRRRRRQAEESGDGKGYCNKELQDYLKGDGDEASGADDAEASGDDKEDGDDGSGDATEEEEDGEDETKCEENKKCQNGKFGNYPDNPLILQISPGCCPDGRTHSQGPKKQGCFECPEVGVPKRLQIEFLLQEVFMCDQCEKTLYGCCPDLQNAAAGFHTITILTSLLIGPNTFFQALSLPDVRMRTGSYMRTAPSLSRTIVIHSWNQTSTFFT